MTTEATVSAKTLAAWCRCTPQHIGRLAVHGVLVKQADGKFLLRPSVGAIFEHERQKRKSPGQHWSGEGRYGEARTSLTRSKAELSRLEVREKEGTLVDVASVRAAWGSIFSVIRTRMLAMPAHCGPRAVGKSANEIARIMGGEVADALNFLAKTRVAAESPTPSPRSSRHSNGNGVAAKVDA
jgi:phage terminase Nu1 subunit (DNA packaging protein)